MSPRAKSPTSPRPSILLVDDDDRVLKAMSGTLAQLGCEVFFSHDQDEALKVAAESPPALVICDIMLASSEGHAVVRRLREAGVNVPVIMMSGRSDRQDVLDSLANGAMDCIRKPWSTPDLLNLVTRALRAQGPAGA